MLGFYLALLDTAEDKSRFEELYLTYRQDMYKTAFAILRSPQSAEDAVHEAFMIVIGKLNKISEINCPQTRAYLIIIVKNLALKMYNESKKVIIENIDETEISDGTDLEADIVSKLSAEELKELLLKLPEQYYQVLFLEMYMELSISETAAIIAAALAASSVSAVRDFFKRFFTEPFSTHTAVQSADTAEAPETIEAIYTIDVPEGFETTFEEQVYEYTQFITYEYEKDDKYIIFSQYSKKSFNVMVDTENQVMEYITVNGKEGYIIRLDDDSYYISWDNGDYIFDIEGNIGKNQLIEIAETVKKAE